MMITGLRVGNFKAFGQTQHVPIRPLTLIFGANSSGKSSLIHALLLAHHAIETGELDTHRTVIGGDSVDLGGFRQYVHRGNASLHVEWVADFSTVNLSQKVNELLPGIKNISVGLTIGPRSLVLFDDLDLADATPLQITDLIAASTSDDEETDPSDAMEKERKLKVVGKIRRRHSGREFMTLRELEIAKGNVHIETLWLEINGTRLLSMKYEKNGNYLLLQSLNSQQAVIAEIIAAMFQQTVGSKKDETQDIRDVEQIVQELIPNISFELGNFLPNRLRDSKPRSEILKESSDLINEENKEEGLRKAIKLDFIRNSDLRSKIPENTRQKPFYGIILSQVLMQSCGQSDTAFVELSEALDSSLWRGRRRTLTVKKREEDYRAALAPILRYARALTLIDPYLNSHESRFFNTVRICSELMGKRGHAPLPGRIHIHAEMKRQRPDGDSSKDYLDAWEKKLRRMKNKDGHRFKVFLWESLPSFETLHDRFILTEQCGVGVQGGLDCRAESAANKTLSSLLDEEDRRIWLEAVTRATSPYKFLDEREVL
jgi:hypothetical protein